MRFINLSQLLNSVRISKMRLRHFRDDFLRFRLYGFVTGTDSYTSIFLKEQGLLESFDTLAKCMKSIYLNVPLLGELDMLWREFPAGELCVIMNQLSDARTSKPNHILHFCESGIFRFGKKFRLSISILNLRKTFDPRVGHLIIYGSDPGKWYYGDNEVIGREFLEDDCLDIALSRFILNATDIIVY